MGNQNLRIMIYSSLAIVLLAMVWGVHTVSAQKSARQEVLRASLQQELNAIDAAVKADTRALKFQLLDVLKAEGGEHSTRAFQSSPFLAAGLLQLEDGQWTSAWFSTKSNDEFGDQHFKTWTAKWPLSKLMPDEAYFSKIGDIGGRAYFAVLVPVKKPGSELLVGVGIFPAARFGLTLSDPARDVRVFDDGGFALSLTHPAYLGTEIRDDVLVHDILSGSDVSLRRAWKDSSGHAWLGVASQMNDSNLFAAVEAPADRAGGTLTSWLYVFLCAVGAIALNWVLFSSLLNPLFLQLAQTEELNEQFKRQLLERKSEVTVAPAAVEPEALIPAAQLPNLNFTEAETESPTAVSSSPIAPPSVEKVVRASLRALESGIRREAIRVETFGLDKINLIAADPIQLQTALEEVLKNAIEAMTDRTEQRLTIVGSSDESGQKLVVQDTGAGINEADMDKIFDPFFSTKDSQGVARGLGLNVARRVVEELSGKIEIHSGPSGTTVEFQWPPAPQAEVARPEAEEEEEFVMAEKSWPAIEIRKPIVRSLD